jgi:nitrite reductase (NADH) small subunit
MTMARDVIVGRVADLPPGSVTLIEEGPYGIAVYNVGGEYHALINRCPHMGAPMCQGRVSGVAVVDERNEWSWTRQGEIVECPWHGWKFGITDGRSLTRPVQRIRKHRIRIERDQVILETES